MIILFAVVMILLAVLAGSTILAAYLHERLDRKRNPKKHREDGHVVFDR